MFSCFISMPDLIYYRLQQVCLAYRVAIVRISLMLLGHPGMRNYLFSTAHRFLVAMPAYMPVRR